MAAVNGRFQNGAFLADGLAFWMMIQGVIMRFIQPSSGHKYCFSRRVYERHKHEKRRRAVDTEDDVGEAPPAERGLAPKPGDRHTNPGDVVRRPHHLLQPCRSEE